MKDDNSVDDEAGKKAGIKGDRSRKFEQLPSSGIVIILARVAPPMVAVLVMLLCYSVIKNLFLPKLTDPRTADIAVLILLLEGIVLPSVVAFLILDELIERARVIFPGAIGEPSHETQSASTGVKLFFGSGFASLALYFCALMVSALKFKLPIWLGS